MGMFRYRNPRQTPEQRKHSLQRAREVLAQADRVLIGAGAGLSTAAGIDYGGQRFRDNFGPFVERYGMTDMYSAGFYPFATEEDRWAYWAHHATVNCLAMAATPLYRKLHGWAAQRDCFVITTNADCQFQKAGFDPERIFATQGDYAHIQCATGRHGVRSNALAFERIERDTLAGRRTRIEDPSLVPRCDICGGPMAMHLRVDGSFVQTSEWDVAGERYRQFVSRVSEAPTVLLELGVGWNTPVWIRMPFERIALETGSPFVRMNFDDAHVDTLIPGGISVEGDLAETLPEVLGL